LGSTGTGRSSETHCRELLPRFERILGRREWRATASELQAFRNFSRDQHGRFSGLMTRAYWQDSVNTLYRYHEISTKPSAASLFTNRFNPNRL
jgi:hypothetical protein